MIYITHTIFTELYKQRQQDNSLEKEWVTQDLLLSQETHLLDMVSMLKIGLVTMPQLLSNLNTQSVRFNRSVCLEFLLSESTCVDSSTTQILSSVHDGLNQEQCILSSEIITRLENQDRSSTYSLNMKKESKRVFLKDILY